MFLIGPLSVAGRWALFLVLIWSGCAAASSGAAADRVADSPGKYPVVSGAASVVDGDGLTVDGVEVRLFGIDAPEVGQYCRRPDKTNWRCGQYSTVSLDRLVGGKVVLCKVREKDAFGRSVAVCHLGELDVAAYQIREGWAVAFRRYSEAYIDDEDAARSAKRGVWAGKFEMPWDWRRRMREQR